jgi:hypothetical protein
VTGSQADDQQRYIRWLMSSQRALPQPGAPLSVEAVELNQAVGVVMEYATVNAATALHRLRAYARHSQRPMRDVVAEVRTGHLPFDPTTPT